MIFFGTVTEQSVFRRLAIENSQLVETTSDYDVFVAIDDMAAKIGSDYIEYKKNDILTSWT